MRSPAPLPPDAARRVHRPAAPLWRLITALPASYVFTWGFMALGLAGLVSWGVDFHEAETGMNLLGLTVFVPVFLATFSARRHGPMLALLVLSAVVMGAAAWGLQHALLT